MTGHAPHASIERLLRPRSIAIVGASPTLGSLGNVLAAPAVRWDSVWYVQIAEHGYRALGPTAFFPFYPLLIHVGSWLVVSPIIAGASTFSSIVSSGNK